MDRNASVSVISEIGADQNYPIHLLEMVFDSETFYLTDAPRTLSWGGNDYTGLGHFLGFSDIEETAEVQVSSVTGTLSGVDQTYISLFLSDYYIDRTVNIYKAFLNSSEAVISNPLLIFSGRISGVSIAEDTDAGTCTIAMEASSQWVDFERRPGRHSVHAEQQIWFPGDKGFEFASEIEKGILWGRSE
jgi:hypothetical protein